MCDDGCNQKQCYYDAYDCNQLCAFTECNYTFFSNNICDESCNNIQCNWDGDGCSLIEYSNDECSNKTDCDIFDISDDWCDMDCNNEYCGYDGNDCKTCSNAESCSILWEVMNVVSNIITADWLIDEDELCSAWFLIDGYQLIGPNNTELDYNCTNLIPRFDRDNNDKLNAFEAVFIVNANSTRSKQINCSMCFDSTSQYYAV